MKTQKRMMGTLLILFFVSHALSAKIELPNIFTDNMVLQRQADVTIWGKATPKKEVTVLCSWDKHKYSVNADSEGNWDVLIKTKEAGGPYTITVSDGSKINLSNIMLGDVWICSGQSNMEMSMREILNHEKEINSADYPNIRLLTVEKNMATTPLDNIKGNKGGWKVCAPQTVADFSAVAYFFGKNLNESINIPIGLIHTSWGGTPVETWTSGNTLIDIPYLKDEVKNIQTYSDEGQIPFYKQRLKVWEDKMRLADPCYSRDVAIGTTLDYDDSNWDTMYLPTQWENAGMTDFDGIVWFRKEIEVPESWQNKELVLSLGSIDDSDETYFNGVKIGETNAFWIHRKYTVPADLVKTGKNIIAVRVNDTGGGGGILGGGEKMYINTLAENEVEVLKLNTDWKYKIAIDWSSFPQAPRNPVDNPNRPTVLYNAMINPLVSFALKGFIFYQGEENVRRAYEYKTLFPTMIMDWRDKWSNNKLPFYYVQLANFMSREAIPQESAWAELREAQLETLSLENTGMVTTIDIGEAYDIHPKNKQDVGVRLALLARSKTYGQDIICYGPMYKAYRIEENSISVSFEYAETGLKTKDEKDLKGFSIAGADGKFYWADALIKGNEVVVSSPQVKFPVAVRYAWANNPECNLCNEAGLPASPFRTDSWK